MFSSVDLWESFHIYLLWFNVSASLKTRSRLVVLDMIGLENWDNYGHHPFSTPTINTPSSSLDPGFGVVILTQWSIYMEWIFISSQLFSQYQILTKYYPSLKLSHFFSVLLSTATTLWVNDIKLATLDLTIKQWKLSPHCLQSFQLGKLGQSIL